jgi:hypothetical protein
MLEPEYEYVDLVFENLNYVRLTPEYIEYLNIQDISESRYINLSSQYIIIKHMKYFEIELKNTALNTKTNFELTYNITTETFQDHLNIYKDITNIAIKDKNGEIYVAVPWDDTVLQEKSASMNILQKVEYKGDNFRIIISE